MITDFAVVPECPGCGDVFLRFVQMAFSELHPAQRVPVSDERGDERQVFLRETVEGNVAQGGSCRGNGRLGVLLGAVEMRSLERELVGDVVPDQRRGVELDGVIKSSERFFVLPEIQISIPETDL